jgi:hypothetical protein
MRYAAMDPKKIQLLSAVFGLVGGVILAFSLNGVISELRLAINALNASIATITVDRTTVVFDGLDRRLENAGRTSNVWVRVGLACLVISAGLAAWGIYAA